MSSVEVNLVRTCGIDDEAVISLRTGGIRRQAIRSQGKPFRFPRSAVETDHLMKVDVMKKIASGYLVMKPNPQDSKTYKVVLDSDGWSAACGLSCELEVKPVEGETPAEVTMDADPKTGATAKEAKDYLESRGLLQFVQSVLQLVVKEKPDDPYRFMARHILGGYEANETPAPVPAPARNEASLINVSALCKVATSDEGLMAQPAKPKYRVGLVECYNKNHPTGGSDKLTNKHRFDSIPMANGVIKTGMSCQILEYHHEEHDRFMGVVSQFDALVVRCNPGHIDGDGGNQQRFDKDMQALAQKKPIWPTSDVMTLMGAKDALVKIKDMDFGLVDTLGYYSPEDMKTGFPKAIAFQPRVVKQNRGSAGEGIWIIKLKAETYCAKYGDRSAGDDEMLVLKEANDNHVEEHTVGEFIEFCVNGRTQKSGTWTSQGTGKYYEGGAEAGGQMVDQRFIATIDTKGEARFFMCGMDLYNIEHYMYIGGVSGETKTTVHQADSQEYAATRKQLEEGTPDYMKALGLDMSQLPLLWAADFLTLEDNSRKIGEFNCSCLGITGFLDARGKDVSACKPEDIARGQAMCDHIGRVALKALENWKK